MFSILLFLFVYISKKKKQHCFHVSHFFYFAFLVIFFLVFLFACVSFHSLRFFTFGQVEGNARDGRSRHQSFRVCKVNFATLKVAINFFRLFVFANKWDRSSKANKKCIGC